MERNGLIPESEIFTTEDTERAQRKNEADFDSDRRKNSTLRNHLCEVEELEGMVTASPPIKA
jgi:hypothetical protein